MIGEHETIGTERFRGLRWGEVGLWGGAMIVMLAASASGVFLAATWRYERELPGAPPPAIMIELAPISVAPQVEDIAADPGPESVEQAAIEPIEAPEPDPAEEPEEIVEPLPEPEPEPVEEEVADPDIVPEPVEDTPPEEEIEELPEPEPEPEPIEEPEPVDEPEPIEEPEPVEQIVPDLTESEVAEVTLPMPVPIPADIQALRENTPATVFTPPPAPQPTPQPQTQQTAPQSVQAQQSTQTAAPEQTTTTRLTPNISPQQWQSQVVAHLDRNKRYPNDARNRREEGVPHLQFTINAAGQVLSARIVRSSGFPALDQAALEMVRRASPVPAPPASIAQSSMMLTVPVNFNLR